MASRAGFKNRERLRSLLKSLPPLERTEIRKALVAGGEQIAGMMRQLAPVGGQGKKRAPAPYLRDSIKASTGDQDPVTYRQVRGRARTQDPELTVVISAGNPVEGTTRSDAHLQEHGTSSNPAQPFFYPSVRANRDEVKSRIKRAVRKAIKDALRRRLAGQV